MIKQTSVKTWQMYMQEHGARADTAGIIRFAEPRTEVRAAQQGTVLIDLSYLAHVRAHADDAALFLQNQLTNDIGLLDDAHSQLSGYCEPKGRLLALFRLFKNSEGYLLQLPRSLIVPTLERLRKYILRTKVFLEESPYVCFGLAGPAAEALLKAQLAQLPLELGQVISANGVTVMRLPGAHPRFQLLGDNPVLQSLWQTLAAEATPASGLVWRWFDIQAGIPSVHPETVERFIPQMLNMDVLQGVSFKKGCYPGQEIVARTQHLGRIKQRMLRAHVLSETCPQPGDLLYAPDFRGQSVGTLVDAQPAPTEGYDLLAALQSSVRGEIYLGSESGPALKLESLPYSLPNSP